MSKEHLLTNSKVKAATCMKKLKNSNKTSKVQVLESKPRYSALKSRDIPCYVTSNPVQVTWLSVLIHVTTVSDFRGKPAQTVN